MSQVAGMEGWGTMRFVFAFAFAGWAAYLLWNGSEFLFMLPLCGAIACCEDGDNGDSDPCMGA